MTFIASVVWCAKPFTLYHLVDVEVTRTVNFHFVRLFVEVLTRKWKLRRPVDFELTFKLLVNEWTNLRLKMSNSSDLVRHCLWIRLLSLKKEKKRGGSCLCEIIKIRINTGTSSFKELKLKFLYFSKVFQYEILLNC